MSLVLDSSATLAWIYAEETTQPIREVVDQVIDRGAWVPDFWKLEVGNALQTALRKRRIDAAFRDASLTDLGHLPIRVDSETGRHAWGPTIQLSERHRLTVYDAAYLELALRRALPLATLDEQLRTAAQAEGALLLGI